MKHVLFFSNGLTAVSENGEQVPELQTAWFELYVQFLEAHGVDPSTVRFTFPNGWETQVFKTDRGYNWMFLPEGAK